MIIVNPVARRMDDSVRARAPIARAIFHYVHPGVKHNCLPDTCTSVRLPGVELVRRRVFGRLPGLGVVGLNVGLELL